MEQKADESFSRRAWGIFHAMIECIHGNRMDQAKYNAAIGLLGKIAHESDARFSFSGDNAIASRLRAGLTPNTSDAEHFEVGYHKFQGDSGPRVA